MFALQTYIQLRLSSLERERAELMALLDAEASPPAIGAGDSGWERYPLMLTMTQAQEVTGLSYEMLIKLTAEPGFPGTRTGSRWLIDRDRLRVWLLERR